MYPTTELRGPWRSKGSYKALLGLEKPFSCMCRRAAVTSCQCQERSWEFREELGILHWAGSTWAHPDCFHKHPAPKAAFETSTVLPFSGQRCLMCSHCSDQGYSRGNAHTAGQKNSAWEGKRWGNPPQKLFFLPWNLKHLGTANGQTWSFCFDGLRRTQPTTKICGLGSPTGTANFLQVLQSKRSLWHC